MGEMWVVLVGMQQIAAGTFACTEQILIHGLLQVHKFM
jgi:hypothetical protein